MSSLYLHKEKEIELRLDGPSLVARVENQADRLFPLRHLQRIFVHSSADIGSRVILRCARAGVVFCFMDARAHPLMWCMGVPDSKGCLSTALQNFMQRTDWESLLLQWQSRHQRQTHQHLARHFKLDQQPINPDEIKDYLARYTIRYAGEESATTSAQWLYTEISGLLITHLSLRKVADEVCIFWAKSLAPLLCWQMESARLRWLGQRFTRYRNQSLPMPPLTHQDFMQFFELKHAALNEAAEQLLEQLTLWLQNLLQET